MTLVNTTVLKNPLNWAIVWAMLLFVMALLYFFSKEVGAVPASTS